VTFTNTSKDDASVSWDFGDGGESGATNKTVTHAYTKAGTYTVTLMVAKGNGKKPSNAPTVTITVKDPEIPAPIADFTISNATPVGAEVVTFTSTSTNAAEFSWDFGDGSVTPTTPNATHAYANGGAFVVTLTVKDVTKTLSSTKTMTVTVSSSINVADQTAINNNMAKIVGKWNYKSRIVTDVRNGVAFTTTSTANGNYGLGLTYATSATSTDMHQFATNGKVYGTDVNGNNFVFGNYNLLDGSTMNNYGTATVAYNGPTPAYATYTVNATSLVITFVSTETLPYYRDYATSSTVGNTTYSYTDHAAGEKQVVTTTYTYSK